jgi:arylsulfatase A-like enzyme
MMRIKALLPPYAPSYVEDDVPNIKRTYEEGARFNNFYCVLPYCNPSRYSLITGMYPHTHGATNNLQLPSNPDMPNMPTILQEAGYHNLVIGKYTNMDNNPVGFDKRMCIKIVDYTDPNFFLDGVKKKIYGNTTRIIDDTMANWISKVDTPFFAWSVILPLTGLLRLWLRIKTSMRTRR